jgi:hypothetical protein
MKYIKLTQGKYTIVDDDMFEELSKWKWSYKKDGGYAVRSQYVRLGPKKRTYKRIWMHRVINNTPDGSLTDHINQNGLDNRKINLRSGNKSLNGINRGKQDNNTSGYKGIYLDSWTGQWRAEIGINGKRYKLGRFNNIKDAIQARLNGELKYHNI